MNGDGFADLLVGALGANEGGSDRGAAYVVFGQAGGFAASVSLGALDGANGFKLSGIADSDYAGISVSAAGDVNGDGFADLLVGANRANEGGTDRGAAYVVFGQAGGFAASVSLGALDGANGFKLSGIADSDFAGISVSAAGDVNGDGFADLLVGADGANEGGTDRGAAYVVFGQAGGFAASASLGALDGANGFKLSGIADADSAGRSVSAAGDVNGDGFADLLIGAFRANEGGTDRGAAYVVFGQPDTKVTFSKDHKTGTFLDTDGDLVTVRLGKGALSQSDFTFRDGVWQRLDLSDSNPLVFGGADVTVTVKKGFGGNGLVNLGALDARGLDLGNVKLPGDLGQIDAGDTNFATSAVKSLTIATLGVAVGTQPASTINPLVSDLVGTLGKLTTTGSVKGVVNVTGGAGAKIGAVSIGGDLDGSAGGTLAGLLRAGGDIGAVTVKGSVIGGADFSGIIAGGKLGKVSIGADLKSANAAKPVILSALGKLGATKAADAVAIAGVSVKTNVLNARVLAGFTASLGAANPDAGIGAISVLGNWTASSVAAGVKDTSIAGDLASVPDGFGRNDTRIGGDTNATVFATIASITVKGTATGSAAGGDFFGITAQRILKAKFGATVVTLTGGAEDELLDPANNDFRLVDFA